MKIKLRVDYIIQNLFKSLKTSKYVQKLEGQLS